jgi:hypothetical protein
MSQSLRPPATDRGKPKNSEGCSELSSIIYCRVNKMIVDRRFRGAYCLHQSLMMEAVRTSETSVESFYTALYRLKEDNSEHHTRRRENLKSHTIRRECHISTTNLAWTGPGADQGLRGKRPATNRHSHGTPK